MLLGVAKPTRQMGSLVPFPSGKGKWEHNGVAVKVAFSFLSLYWAPGGESWQRAAGSWRVCL